MSTNFATYSASGASIPLSRYANIEVIEGCPFSCDGSTADEDLIYVKNSGQAVNILKIAIHSTIPLNCRINLSMPEDPNRDIPDE